MRLTLLLLLCLGSGFAPAQSGKLRPEVQPPEDTQLRAEAVQLMERAAMVSTPVWPASESSTTFRILEPMGSEATSGQLKINVATPITKRWEYTYGSYRFSQVQSGSEFATNRTEPNEPAAVTSVLKLLPVFVGEFDDTDIIRRIEDVIISGRAARCIHFETLKGDKQVPGSGCVDIEQGWLLEITQGVETIRQSDFYRFNNGFFPHHIETLSSGRKTLEIESNVVVREQYPDDYFAYPEGAHIWHRCREFHRAFADKTPQPQAKAISDDAIVVRVHGYVGKDGKPTGLKVLDTGRADLSAEALRILSGWTYHPAMCEYNPATMETDFVVNFKGW